MRFLLDGLNRPQQEAVRHMQGPLLVLAGPGSGKTRVVTHRIGWLLHHGVRGSQILALTFTNKAADEMRHRIERMAPKHYVWIGTFHKFCASMLRRYAPYVGLEQNFTIYDADDSKRALKAVLQEGMLPKGIDVSRVASAISHAKNELMVPESYQAHPGSLLGKVVEEVYPKYRDYLLQANAMDFDDLLLRMAMLLRENPEIRKTLDHRFRYILVDEYQDTNLPQYTIARALSIDYPNLAVTGDPDQSIYGWRGAKISNILDFENDFPEVRIIRLEENYRSTKSILHIASTLIANNVLRKEKKLFTANVVGEPVRLICYRDHNEEAEQIAAEIAEEVESGKRRPGDFAIFYRVNALSRNLEHALRRWNVPFQLVRGLEFFRRREIKDVLAYLQLLNNPSDNLAFLRVVNVPRRGIGKTTLRRLAAEADRRGVCLLEAARGADQIHALSARAKKSLLRFVAMVDRLSDMLEEDLEVLLASVLTETGLLEIFRQSELEEDQQRLANVQELISEVREFDARYDGDRPLEGFLEETSLTSDVDDWEAGAERVSLMTLHAAKGLEFPVVYLIGIEESLLPHERSSFDQESLEEERRLFFVGMTRAQQQLRLSRADTRQYRGRSAVSIMSRFLLELPNESMEIRESFEQTGVDRPAHDSDKWVLEKTETIETESLELFDEPETLQRSGRKRKRSPLGLTIAAEMAGENRTDEEKRGFSVGDFQPGQLVRHEQYGIGVIKRLSGKGEERRAAVDFLTSAGRVDLLLEESGLVPIGGRKS